MEGGVSQRGGASRGRAGFHRGAGPRRGAGFHRGGGASQRGRGLAEGGAPRLGAWPSCPLRRARRSGAVTVFPSRPPQPGFPHLGDTREDAISLFPRRQFPLDP